MARIVKEHAVRRNEILDAAQRLVYTKGYEQMTIQDILDALGIAKGTFFHYFGSKQALLEALIERTQEAMEQVVIPIVQDPRLSAMEKLTRLFGTIVSWKDAHQPFFLALLRVWYADTNAIVRQKLWAGGTERFTPLFTAIIQQGIEEGVLASSHPDKAGGVVLSLIQGMGEAVVRLLLSAKPGPALQRDLEDTIAIYTEALERVLGAPPASLQIVDADAVAQWVELVRESRPETL